MKKIISLALIPAVCLAGLHGKSGIELVDKLDVKQSFLAQPNKPKDSGYASFLLNLNQKQDIKTLKMDESSNPYDSGLKKTLSALTIANSFKPVPLSDNDQVIGFTVVGSYKKNGWTGAKEFFNSHTLGVCSYSKSPFIYMQLEKGAAQYDVNNKVTTIDYEGSAAKGYLTSVSWYETGKQNFEYRLECASNKMDKNIKNKMISLASAIDTQ